MIMGELTIVENRPLTKQDVIAQKRLIREVMEAVMKEGTHYGTIPGCKQPSLYKAGSEAILSTFRIAVDPSIEELSTSDCVRYRITLRGVLPSGEIIGAGVGECSTDEEKYRWRSSVNDKEFDATPEDRRRIKYSRPNNYNQSGETKQVRTVPADLANTVLKMAKKRAQIDLTLTATGASDVFVQDLEDLPEEIRDELVKDDMQKKVGKPEVKPPQSKSGKQPELTETQAKYYPRIDAALTACFGDDQSAKDAKLIELTTWVKNKGKDNEETVKGTADYRLIKADKSLEILAHRLEQLVPKKDVVESDHESILCEECGQPHVDGACRNLSCCEGKEYE